MAPCNVHLCSGLFTKLKIVDVDNKTWSYSSADRFSRWFFTLFPPTAARRFLAILFIGDISHYPEENSHHVNFLCPLWLLWQHMIFLGITDSLHHANTRLIKIFIKFVMAMYLQRKRNKLYNYNVTLLGCMPDISILYGVSHFWFILNKIIVNFYIPKNSIPNKRYLT